MVSPLSSRTGTPVKWGQGSKIQKAEKRTAESAMTDGFVEKIKEYAKQDAKQGVYMSKGFIQFRLARMEQCVSPDRSGPKADVMSAIQAALKERCCKLLKKYWKNFREAVPQTSKSARFIRPLR